MPASPPTADSIVVAVSASLTVQISLASSTHRPSHSTKQQHESDEQTISQQASLSQPGVSCGTKQDPGAGQASAGAQVSGPQVVKSPW